MASKWYLPWYLTPRNTLQPHLSIPEQETWVPGQPWHYEPFDLGKVPWEGSFHACKITTTSQAWDETNIVGDSMLKTVKHSICSRQPSWVLHTFSKWAFLVECLKPLEVRINENKRQIGNIANKSFWKWSAPVAYLLLLAQVTFEGKRDRTTSSNTWRKEKGQKEEKPRGMLCGLSAYHTGDSAIIWLIWWL